jgi:hypothetical protein
MPDLTEPQALAKCRASAPISFDDLDDIFKAFGFRGELAFPDTIWYSHPKYPCGRFPANPQHEFSVLSDTQRVIVLRMVQELLDRRGLEEE